MKREWLGWLIADDPAPEYSALDQRDGLITDQAAFDALAARMFGAAS